MNYPEKIAEKLNRLLEKNLDAEKSYRFAAENISDPQLKAFFHERAEERYDFGHQLKSAIRDFGQSPKEESSFLGDAHRTWMNLKAAFSADKTEATLEEAARGEQTAVSEYEQVLQEPGIPPKIIDILRSQKDAIVSSLNKVKSLETQA